MPFEMVHETLLKAGIAPRRVGRYVAELHEHLDDLIDRQHASGYEGEDAVIRARALLGEDNELAAAMLTRKDFRSWPARLPWLVFVVLPPIATLIGAILLLLPLYLVGDGAWKISAVTGLPPDTLRGFSQSAIMLLNVGFVPVGAVLFLSLAQRQRLALFWPLLGVVLLLVLLPHVSYRYGLHHVPGYIGINAAPYFSRDRPWLWQNWPVMAAQWMLTIAAVSWLLRRRLRSA